jgi:TolB protein
MNHRIKKSATCLLVAMLGLAAPAFAQLRLTITSGVTDPIPIAIVPFAAVSPTGNPLDVAQVIERDLQSSGRFKPMARTDMINKPNRAAEVDTASWKQMHNDYVVVGRVSLLADGSARVEADLVNVLNGQQSSHNTTVPAGNFRKAAHRVADMLYEKIVGVKGAFDTRIAYVAVSGKPPTQRYELIVADSDNENRKKVMSSPLPIMSPSWSPDGEWLAYVSFERRVSTVFLQHLKTAKKIPVSARAGINGAPSYSPDGKKLLLTLSGSNGNLDVYVLDLATQQLTRLTDDQSIDTEAVFAPDGSTIYFTSDRSGNPQIYRMTLGSKERPRRVTFQGAYNARPRVSPDGKQLALLTQAEGSYRIGVQDIASGNLQVLSKGRQEESPSFAPNGAMLIFAGRQNGQGMLQTISVDGQIAARLDADAGEVREPVWGPFQP